MVGELVIFFGIVAVAAIGGILVGMLVAPRLGRLMERNKDEDQDNDGE